MVHRVRQLFSLTPLAVRVAGLYVAAGLLVTSLVIGTATPPAVQTAVAQPVPKVEPETPRIAPILRGSPTRLVVDRIGLDLPVANGFYDQATNEWTLSDTEAFFATLSDLPNDDRGSTFIYGHNRPTAFEPLRTMAIGDTVRIMTSNGLVFTYVYTRDAIVQPTMTEVLREDPEDPQLVLMTCEGVWSEVRRIMYFSLQGVSGA